MLDLDMGRYGLYVWGSWGVTAVALVGLSMRALVVSRRWKKALSQLEEQAE